MFDFNEDKLSVEQVMAIAAADNIPPLRVAINANGYRQSQSFWKAPVEIDSTGDKYPVISLGNDCDVVGKLSSNIARSVQFPESSAYMHFLGCISAAMLGRFTVEYHGTQQPTALYVVTSQPPSTGKSAINSLAIAPMVAEVERMNDQRKRERKKIMAKLSALAKEMKQEKSPSEMASLFEEKEDLEEKLEKLCDIVFPVSDTTPEGLARINSRQGNFAVISDEATAINSLLGMTYGDGSKKTNSELVLKAWDSGNISISRANADNNLMFTALGAIAVIAQDETINAIMEAGARGIGVSERFWLVRERPMIGSRVFINEKGESTYESVDGELKADYFRMIHNIMNETQVNLSISESAMRYLNLARQDMEPHLADGGKYSHSMLRGALGKMDKQVIRMAAILHTIRNWSCKNNEQPLKSKQIDLETMQEAIIMFHEQSKTYLSAASSAGHAGDNAEMNKLIDILIKQGKNSKGVVGLRSLYESARKVRPFEGQAGVMAKIKDHLLPMLDEKNYTCLIGDKVYINPRLLG